MDPATALGVACNVIQVIVWSAQTIATINEVCKDGSSGATRTALANALQDAELNGEVEKLSMSPSSTPAERQLVLIAKEAQKISEELRNILTQLHAKSATSRPERLKVAINTLIKSKHIGRLQESLKVCQSRLEQKMVVSLWQKVDLLSTKHRDAFDKLSSSQQDMFSAITTGQKSVHDLLVSQSARTLQAIQDDGDKTRQQLESHHAASLRHATEGHATTVEAVSKVTAHLDRSIDDQVTTIEQIAHDSNTQQMSHMTLEAGDTRRIVIDSQLHLETRMNEMKTIAEVEGMRKELLSTLSFPEMQSRQENLKPQHVKTFEWLLDDLQVVASDQASLNHGTSSEVASATNKATKDADSEHDRSFIAVEERSRRSAAAQDFSSWLRTGTDVFWIVGKAGSGKSILMNFIATDRRTAEALRCHMPEMTMHIVPVFFFLAGSSDQQSIPGMLKTILYKICSAIPESLSLLVRHIGTTDFKSYVWSQTSLQTALISLLLDCREQHRFCLFIDGLDEFTGDPEELTIYLRKLSTIGNVKLCVSSRPIQKYRFTLGEPRIVLQDINRSDISRMVRDRLEHHEHVISLKKDNNRRIENLLGGLIAAAAGVFLWASFAVKHLLEGCYNGDTMDILEARLSSLPLSDLDALYAFMMKQMPAPYRAQAAETIMFVSLSPMPTYVLDLVLQSDLGLLELFEHCQTPGEASDLFRKRTSLYRERLGVTARQVETQCANILEVLDLDPALDESESLVESRTRIRFVHRSARDFFNRGNHLKSLFGDDSDTAQDHEVFLHFCQHVHILYILIVLADFRRGIQEEMHSELFDGGMTYEVLVPVHAGGKFPTVDEMAKWRRLRIFDGGKSIHLMTLDLGDPRNMALYVGPASDSSLEGLITSLRLINHEQNIHGIIVEDVLEQISDTQLLMLLYDQAVVYGSVEQDQPAVIFWYPYVYTRSTGDLCLMRHYMEGISERCKEILWLFLYKWEITRGQICGIANLIRLRGYTKKPLDAWMVCSLLDIPQTPKTEIWDPWKVFLANRFSAFISQLDCDGHKTHIFAQHVQEDTIEEVAGSWSKYTTQWLAMKNEDWNLPINGFITFHYYGVGTIKFSVTISPLLLARSHCNTYSDYKVMAELRAIDAREFVLVHGVELRMGNVEIHEEDELRTERGRHESFDHDFPEDVSMHILDAFRRTLRGNPNIDIVFQALKELAADDRSTDSGTTLFDEYDYKHDREHGWHWSGRVTGFTK